MFYVLFYDYIADIGERRPAFRDAHLAALGEHVERGEVVLGGAWADPLDGAAIVFKTADRGVVERFVGSDPYVTNGLVSSWRIREWTVVVGAALRDAPTEG